MPRDSQVAGPLSQIWRRQDDLFGSLHKKMEGVIRFPVWKATNPF